MSLSNLRSTLNNILISKNELKEDIVHIEDADNNLGEVCDIYTKTSKIDRSRMEGSAAMAFVERLNKLNKDMSAQADACKEVAGDMKTVLAEFERTEREIQAQINLLLRRD